MQQKQVVDVFLDIKRKLDKQSEDYLSKILPFDEDRAMLMNQDGMILLQYIKQMVVYLVKSKLELLDRINNQRPSDKNNQQDQYESLIQKLEADVRQHIRVEQQLRLYAESTCQKYEDSISDLRKMQDQLISVQKQLSQSQQMFEKINYELRQKETQLLQLKSKTNEQIIRVKSNHNSSITSTEPEQYQQSQSQSQQLDAQIKRQQTSQNILSDSLQVKNLDNNQCGFLVFQKKKSQNMESNKKLNYSYNRISEQIGDQQQKENQQLRHSKLQENHVLDVNKQPSYTFMQPCDQTKGNKNYISNASILSQQEQCYRSYSQEQNVILNNNIYQESLKQCIKQSINRSKQK